jgi:serine phosphatase RsbU (regulator of sigma subunit)/signal transduction protein with GAF and PtsI domain
VFIGLSLFAQRSSFHLGSPVHHSLAGVIDLAAVLALGPASGAVVAAFSGLAYLELNALHRGKLQRHYLLEIPLFNAGLKAILALMGGELFVALHGSLPLGSEAASLPSNLKGPTILAFSVVCLAWFLVDHLAWGLLDYLGGGLDRLRIFVRDEMPLALLVEFLPLFFSLLVAWVYSSLDWGAFSLMALAIVAVAILAQRWADAQNSLVDRVAELSIIEEVGRAITQAQLDVDELCALLYEQATRIADTTIFHLGLFEGDRYTLKLWMREGRAEAPSTFRLQPGAGLVSWMREAKRPILVRDFQKELDSLPARPVYASDNPPRSALFVPLMAGETVIGTLSIQSYQQGAYDDSDLRVFSAMANQAAVAIQKAQLYSQEHKRVRQLETIGEVGRQVTAIVELDELFGQVVSLIRENFGYYHVAIYAADPETQRVTFQTSSSTGDEDVSFEVEWGQGLIGWVAAHAQSVTVNDVEADTRYRCVEALEETQSELAVPLCLDYKLLGVLDVQSDQVGAFGPDDLFILETLGDQVAIAIHEARLYQAERRQAWLSTALLQVADAMSQVSDIEAVLTTLVRLTPMLAGVDRCAILNWDAEAEAYIPTQTHGLAPDLSREFKSYEFPAGSVPAMDLVRWEKRPLRVRPEDDRQLLPRDLVERFDILEVLLLPLLAQGELQGIMMVDFAGEAHSFSERIVEMLTGIANQAAMVLQSARLVQAQREEAYVSMALLQVAEAVGRSTELRETLATIVRITPILVGVEACTILLREPEATTFLPFEQYGLQREAQSSFWELRLPLDESPARELLQGIPHVFFEGPDSQIGKLLGGSAALAFPLATKGEVLGTMIVDYVRSRRPKERWTNILAGIAGQAAIAVENDYLLREAAEQERIKQELSVARRIQTSFLPETCAEIPGWEVAAAWRSARQVGGDFYDFVPLPGEPGVERGKTGIVIADVADKGVPAALFMALSRTLVRTVAMEGRPPAATVARANDLIVADARSGLFVTLFYAMLQPNSGEVTYVNAGHMPPLVVRSAGAATEELRTDGMALGVLAGVEFEQKVAHLDPGDALILYTDGVSDAENPSMERFERESLKDVVEAHRSRSAQELVQAINSAVTSFAGDAAQYDDFTLVVVRRIPR